MLEVVDHCIALSIECMHVLMVAFSVFIAKLQCNVYTIPLMFYWTKLLQNVCNHFLTANTENLLLLATAKSEKRISSGCLGGVCTTRILKINS